jgi:UDP-N-acetylglucosamine 3-dehydrogenase
MSSKGSASDAKTDVKRALRVGVVGAGVMGSNHARVLAGLPDVTLVGIVDPLPEHRARATAMVGCRAFADLEELFDEGVDAITIAAPTHLHHEISLACITRNIHILVEKPVATTVEEGQDIVNAARRAGVTLMVGHVERFNPAVAAIKQAISGEDILSIGITRVGPFPPRMSNVGVEVQPQLSSAVAEREDIALLQFRTASGVLAHINTNWLTPFKARNVTVATRGKYVMGDLLTRQVTECFGFKPDGSYSMRHLPVGHDEPLRAELIAFLDAVRTGNVPAVTGDEGVASLAIAIRCLDQPAKPAASAARKGPRRIAG